MRQVRTFFGVMFFCWFMRNHRQWFCALGKAEVQAWVDWILAPRKAPKHKGYFMKELHSLARLVLLCIGLSRPFYWMWAKKRIKSGEDAQALADWAMAPLGDGRSA